MAKYDIISRYFEYEKRGYKFDYKEDVLESKSRVLYPGRFYVLHYKANVEKLYNARPVIISIGISKKDPSSFLCIDLCVMPLKVREKFIEMYFKLYQNQIVDNMNKYYEPVDADKQTQIKGFDYETICKVCSMLPVKNAIKRYKIENTHKIFSVPFSGVYKLIGKFCDENNFVNGSVVDAQKEFMSKRPS